MKSGISIREFARREGVSDILVRKALKLKRLKALSDKTIDPNLIGTGWRHANAVATKSSANQVRTANRQKGANHHATANLLKRPPALEKLAGSCRKGKGRGKGPQPGGDEPESPEEVVERLLASGEVEMLPYGQALEKKENYLALLRQLEYLEKSGAVIDIEVAERVIFNAGRSMRDAWLNWPTRVGALIGADLGLEADRVTEILTTHVHKHIEQLGDPDVLFRQA